MLLTRTTEAALRDLPWIEADNGIANRSARRLGIEHGISVDGKAYAAYRDAVGTKRPFLERAQPDPAAARRRAIYRAVISRLNSP